MGPRSRAGGSSRIGAQIPNGGSGSGPVPRTGFGALAVTGISCMLNAGEFEGGRAGTGSSRGVRAPREGFPNGGEFAFGAGGFATVRVRNSSRLGGFALSGGEFANERGGVRVRGERERGGVRARTGGVRK